MDNFITKVKVGSDIYDIMVDKITTTTNIENGSRFIISDSTGHIVASSITFDGSTTTKALSQAGTWVDVDNYELPIASSTELGGIKVGENLDINSETGLLKLKDSPDLKGNATAVTPDVSETTGTRIATVAYVKALISASNAMIFKGVVDSNSDLPTEHEAGWTYKVRTAGTYAGVVCEAGDMILCVADGESASNDDWAVIQTNIDGAVTGPTSAVNERIAVFDGTTGKVIADSGFSKEDFATSTHVHEYTTTDASVITNIESVTSSFITSWTTGVLPAATVENETLIFDWGSLPQLNMQSVQADHITYSTTTVVNSIRYISNN